MNWMKRTNWIKAFYWVAAVLFLSGCAAGGELNTDASTSSSSAQLSSDADHSAGSAADASVQTDVSAIKEPAGGVHTKVIKVVDGDTFQVLYQKKVVTVRVLLIDTPETHHPSLGVQPYGPEASSNAHKLLDGKTVTLELAKNGGRDKYGRLLAYVFVDGRSFEALQLAAGLARVAYVYPPNTKYVDQFRAVEQQAKTKRLGVWSVNGYAAADGFHPDLMKGTDAYREIQGRSKPAKQPSAASAESNSSPDGACQGKIKGNISSRGKIYHMPSDPYYKVTKAERCFKSRTEAENAGFRAAK
ncbi:hypothetical protein St703_22710 [Sporolactobacillus terrae]|uniref:TNase-like domain-containing protein n=2 Tax=Sporolactobacillus terrae TaxID=269673 RepID=A0A5K7X6W3_9BACL|nr:hypothetical protein St703_22710 [Sporolactobacillus terrae]